MAAGGDGAAAAACVCVLCNADTLQGTNALEPQHNADANAVADSAIGQHVHNREPCGGVGEHDARQAHILHGIIK